jgi:hypothetical protein
MIKRQFRLFATLALLTTYLSLHSLASSHAQPNGRFFPETGKSVKGIFLDYWNAHGGLAQQGYPISAEMQELSDTDGKAYLIQYFERAVFEYHPDEKPEFQVLLSLLGTFYYQQKYGAEGAPNQVPNPEGDSVLIPETGKHLGGLFLAYWQGHGGLAQQGYPISNEFNEVSDLNGKTYRVQYFQRAVFEYHPEEKPEFQVLLSQLGTFRYGQKNSAVEECGDVPANQDAAFARCGSEVAIGLVRVNTSGGDNFRADDQVRFTITGPDKKVLHESTETVKQGNQPSNRFVSLATSYILRPSDISGLYTITLENITRPGSTAVAYFKLLRCMGEMPKSEGLQPRPACADKNTTIVIAVASGLGFQFGEEAKMTLTDPQQRVVREENSKQYILFPPFVGPSSPAGIYKVTLEGLTSHVKLTGYFKIVGP